MPAAPDQPKKKAPKVPVPFRMSPEGKAAIEALAPKIIDPATGEPYKHYTAWIRDAVAERYARDVKMLAEQEAREARRRRLQK